MKKTLYIVLVCVMALGMLAACGSKEKESSSSALAPDPAASSAPDSSAAQSEVVASSSQPDEVIPRKPSPGQTAIAGSDLQLKMYSRDGDGAAIITLTLHQQNYIQRELQVVMDRYANGDYPLQADVNGKSTSFDTGWPSGVIRPATLPLQQMILSTVGQEAYPLSVQVALTKGWFMECALVVDAEDSTNIDYSSKDNIWIPADAFFIDPAGLVHDLPGDPADDDTVVVIS